GVWCAGDRLARSVQLERRQRRLRDVVRRIAVDRHADRRVPRAIADYVRRQDPDADARHAEHRRFPRDDLAGVQAVSRVERQRCRDEVHRVPDSGAQRGRPGAAARRGAPLGGMDRAALQRQVQFTMRFHMFAALLVAVAFATPPAPHAQAERDFDLLEKTIPELQAAMAAGTVTSKQLVAAYLARIKAYDDSGPRLRAI